MTPEQDARRQYLQRFRTELEERVRAAGIRSLRDLLRSSRETGDRKKKPYLWEDYEVSGFFGKKGARGWNVARLQDFLKAAKDYLTPQDGVEFAGHVLLGRNRSLAGDIPTFVRHTLGSTGADDDTRDMWSDSIGRDADTRMLLKLLEAERAVVVLGDPEVGKSHLAELVARAHRRKSSERRVHFVKLAHTANDTTDLTGVIAEKVLWPRAVLYQVAGDSGNALRSYLCNHDGLLVLDGCDWRPEASATFVRTFLSWPTRFKLLATSSQPLDVPGVKDYWLRPFDLPGADATWNAAKGNPAVALFLKSHRTAGFEGTDGNLLRMMVILRATGGFPGKIERAALLDSRQDGSALPAADSEAAYALAGEEGQRLFPLLAVFSEDWEIGAAQAVGKAADLPGTDRPDRVRRWLRELIAVKLVVPSKDKPGRYEVEEHARDFARAKFDELPVALRHRVQLAFASRLADLAAAWEPRLWTGDQAEALRALDLEGTNLKAAMAWCVVEHPATGERLGANLWRFWQLRGNLQSALHLLTDLLSRPEGDPLLRARVMLGAGYLARNVGDLEAGRDLTQRSQKAFDELSGSSQHAAECARGRGMALANLGIILRSRGRYDDALSTFKEALTSARDQHDVRASGSRQWNIGVTLRAMGRRDEARLALEEALQEEGEGHALSLGHRFLGLLETDAGRYRLAARHIRKSLQVSRSIGDVLGEGAALCTLAEVGRLWQKSIQTSDEPSSARDPTALLLESEQILAETGDRLELGWLNAAWAALHLTRPSGGSDRTAAAKRVSKALELFEGVDQRGTAHALCMAAAVLLTDESALDIGVKLAACAGSLQPRESVLSEQDHQYLEGLLANARERLGEDRIATLSDEGAQMSLSECTTVFKQCFPAEAQE